MKRSIFLLLSIVLLLTACGNEQDKEETSKTAEKSTPETFLNIQDLDVKIVEDEATIHGKAKASDNKFYFHVEKGDHIIREEESIQVDGEWGEFEFTINITEEMKDDEEVVFVKFFNRNGERIVNPNYVPLDIPR